MDIITSRLVNPQRYAIFDIEINGRDLCSARGDTEDATDEETQAGCSATTYAIAGSQLLIYICGSKGRGNQGCVPSWGPNSFIFMQFFSGTNLQNITLTHPLLKLTLPLRKILDPSLWKRTIIAFNSRKMD